MKKKQASLTVEATFVLPLFFICFIAILYLFRVLYIQETLQYAISETGKNIAKQVSFIEHINLLPDDVDQSDLSEDSSLVQKLMQQGMSVAYLRQMVREYLDLELIKSSVVVNGYDGISFLGSSIDNDRIDIVISYRVEIPFILFNNSPYQFYQRVTLQAWTGTKICSKVGEISEGEELEGAYVYITATGTVYHTNQYCSHINLDEKMILGRHITTARNHSGGKYKPCERCAAAPIVADKEYIITGKGDRYHTTVNCSGLKRTVKKVKQVDVSHLKCCTRCSKQKK